MTEDELRALADKAEFEQKIRGDTREIRMVIPNDPSFPLKDYTVCGERARRKIAKFVLAMAAGYCRMVGVDQVEALLFKISEAITSEPCIYRDDATSDNTDKES